MQHLWISIESRVDEANRRLANRNTLLIDSVENRSEDGGRGARAADQGGLAVKNDDHVIAHGGEVGVAAPAFVVDAAGSDGRGRVVGARGRVGFVWGVGVGEVGVQCRVLVGGTRVDVAESAAAGEARDGDFGVCGCGCSGWEEGGAEGGQVWAGCGEVWIEDQF